MPQMNAVTITGPGEADVLVHAQVHRPEPPEGEVLVEVVAAGVNRADVMQRQGFYPPPPGASELPGLEVSGTIAALGADVTGWSVGQQVCALLADGVRVEGDTPLENVTQLDVLPPFAGG